MNIFVIMPFDSDFDSVYMELIKTPLEKRGHEVRRADDVATHQNILKAIVKSISDASLIIADLTTQNPNVYYELGIAHALLRPTIQIVQNIEDVPFDLRTYTVIPYSEHFTVATKLKDDILEYVERESGNEYGFSNPVSDTLGREVRMVNSTAVHRVSDASESLSIRESAAEGTDDDEGEDSFENEMGLLDGIVAAEEASVEMFQVASGIADEFSALSEKTRAHAEKINEINANSNQKGSNSKRLQVARQFASDLNDFSASIKTTVPRLNRSWKTTDQGLERFLSLSNIKNQEELAAARKLLSTIERLQGGLKENRKQFNAFREVQTKIRGLSKATDRALMTSDRTLQSLDGEFGLGESVIVRAIDLLNDLIARYMDSPNKNDVS